MRKPPRDRNVVMTTQCLKQYRGRRTQAQQQNDHAYPESLMETIIHMETGSFPLPNKNYQANKELIFSTLPHGWSELSRNSGEGQYVFARAVFSEHFPFISHTRMWKFDLVRQNTEFYSHSKLCDGPDVTYFWDNPVMKLPTVLSLFDRMVECVGIHNKDFDPLKGLLLPIGERNNDGVWRSKK